MNDYIVYVRTDVNGIIIEINSSAFITDTACWTEIDEGTGDKYHHAQNCYLSLGLTDSNRLYNYKLVDGEVVERTAEDKAPEIAAIAAQVRIAELKGLLAATDYISAKIAEGAATVAEYAEEIAERAAWRAEINQLEEVIND